MDNSSKTKFLKWVKDLKYLNYLELQSILWVEVYNSASLYIFYDASSNAYATVIYLTFKTDNKLLVNFVDAWAKISPLKSCTIPRTELSVATRLNNSLSEDSDFQELNTYFWTDSTTALTWINKDENWNVFVYNIIVDACTGQLQSCGLTIKKLFR